MAATRARDPGVGWPAVTARGRGYHLELERVRLRAMLAIVQAGSGPRLDDGTVERMRADLAQLERALATARAQGSRGVDLAARLGLGEDELDLLWTAVAVAADPRVMPHAQVLGGENADRGLTLVAHVLIAGLDGARARALGLALCGDHPLFRHRILGWGEGREAPAARPLVVPARVVRWLAGDDALDDALGAAGARLVPPDAGALRLDERQAVALARMRRALATPPGPLLLVEGPTGAGRRTAVAAAARDVGQPTVALDLARLPPGPGLLDEALAGLHRECLLTGALPVVAGLDALPDGDGALRRVAQALDAMPGPAAAIAGPGGVELRCHRPVFRTRFDVPDAATRGRLWRAAASEAAVSDAELEGLAARYRMGAGGIARAVASAALEAGAPGLPQLVEGVRATILARLGDVAQRREVAQGWEDLVLAPDILDQVRALVARVRHAPLVLDRWELGRKLPRGTGVAALFSGAPGTGKTMVAGLVARELDLELYQVDLSKIVSKWVGETEKQLARVFDAAEAGHALLLFDEADSLFARRTEVKSAIDRYSNLEVNYLLQRIESFGGVTILTTNLDTSIDPALRRRLAGHIAFWPPDQAERVALWGRMLSSRAPIEGELDLDALAAAYVEMTGANIRNAVLSAAFLAAGEGSGISQAHLDRAARGEYAAMGRVVRAGSPGGARGSGSGHP
jgi:ATPase family protein associated with various cellular activities (AAA)